MSKLLLSTLVSRARVENPQTKTTECVIDANNVDDFLSFNTSNRKYSKAVAKGYRDQFLRGVWLLNGENFIFSTENTEDGPVDHVASAQHRLYGFKMALETYAEAVEFGTAKRDYPDFQEFFVVPITTGVPHENVDLIDIGKVRNHADILYRAQDIDDIIPSEWAINGTRRNKWCKTLATAGRLVWQRTGGKAVSSAEKFDHKEMLEFVSSTHPHLHAFVTMTLDAIDNDDGAGGIKISPAYVAGLTYLACLDTDGKIFKAKEDLIEEFLLHLAQGVVQKGSPGHAITGYWNKLPPGSKNRDLEVVGPFVKCLKALMNGDDVVTPSQMKLTKKEIDGYKEFPPLLDGWDLASFEEAVQRKQEAQDEALARKNAEPVTEEDDNVVDTDDSAYVDDDSEFYGDDDSDVLDPSVIPAIDD